MFRHLPRLAFPLGLAVLTLLPAAPVLAQSTEAPTYRQRQEDRVITRRQPGDRSLQRLNSDNEVRRRQLLRQQGTSDAARRSVPVVPRNSRGSVVVNQ